MVEVQLEPELVVQGTAPSRPAVPEEAVSRALALHVVVVMEVQVELGLRLHNRSASARVPWAESLASTTGSSKIALS